MDTTTSAERLSTILDDFDTGTDLAAVRANLEELKRDLYHDGLIQCVLVRFTRPDGTEFFTNRGVRATFRYNMVRLETCDPDPALMQFVLGGELHHDDNGTVTGWTASAKTAPDLTVDVWSLKVSQGAAVGFVRWTAGLELAEFESMAIGGAELALPVLKAEIKPGTFGFHAEPHLPAHDPTWRTTRASKNAPG